MRSHPVINILLNKYKNLYNKLSKNSHIILLPEVKTLMNVQIDLDFIKKHIFCKSHLKDIYINLFDQCIESDTKFVYTSYGFEENRICEIIKIETNSNYNFLKIIFINIPVEGEWGVQWEENVSLHYHLSNNPNENSSKDLIKYKNDLTLFFNKNGNCRQFLYSKLSHFIYTYIIVKGYENCIGKKIITIVDDTLKLQNNANEKLFGKDIKTSLIKYTYSYLYSIIWKQLIKYYEKIESKIQEKMNYLRKDLNCFLKKLGLENVSLFHVETLSFHIKQIEKCNNPIDKIIILDNISKIICEIISCTNQNLKKQNLAIYDINSDSLIAILVAAISYGQVQNIISHSIHLHMYIDNLKASEKIDKLSFIFTIFHTSIIYLCDIKDV
ncbi:VPS9 domain-containing protein [Plasmodium brasilianum]|uniref:VPS9 domain-containing protein n=2 Tax=Plasmodium (Plasmodium) TaxID=418103 RepID=A0A1A8W3W9_PLAMA|nr:conserved Plasmodium protein, unknown function [Plasmodium malariae]KAI4838508.1 VPS9 domain-containing protein [Plasmodium brasilianum]SBS85849.1 hypothetical protein PMALA_014050 [Plasmodium malariae]SCN12908.1 conserved Plasmodium protein, unknown function [Plasmodium malariae]